MKITFAKWGRWNTALECVALYGTVDGRRFGIAFSGTAISEFFGVEKDPFVIENAFMRNQAFMNEIAREVIEAGRLEEDNTLILHKKDLLSYLERRAATAPA